MRVTQSFMVDQSIRSMETNLESLYALQEKVSSTKQYKQVSESPVNASAALGLRSSLRAGQSYLEAAKNADDWMSAADLALGQLEDVAAKTINLAQRGATDTLEGTDRSAIAAEVDALLNQAVEAGNASHGGSYLFAGFDVKTKPFTLDTGTPDQVTYHGDAGMMQRSLGPNHSMALNVHGNNDINDPAQPSAFSRLYTGMIALRDALTANDTTAINAQIDTLSDAAEKVSELRTVTGARQVQVNARIKQLDETQLSLKTMLAGKEDVNMVEAIAQLRLQETVYQSTLEVSKRTLATANLFQYLG